MRLRVLCASGLVLLAVLAGAAVAQPGGGFLTYTGHVFSDPNSEVRVRVGPTAAIVRIENLKVSCDLGPKRIDLAPLKVERHRGTSYDGEYHVVGDGAELYYRVRLEVFGDHRSIGDIVYFRNGFGASDPSYDCSSRRAIAWRATR